MAETGAAKVVVVTGVTRGLGRAMAEGFAARGHTVVGCGRSEADLGSLRQALGPNLQQILLYGSWARGDATSEWNVDLLVILDTRTHAVEGAVVVAFVIAVPVVVAAGQWPP